MIRIVTLTMIFVLVFTASGCETIFKDGGGEKMPAAERPDDFSLTLSWFTGHMAYEEDMYSYGITIGPAGEGFFTYRSGDQLWQLSESFPISDEELDLFYKKLIDLGAMQNKWQSGDPIDGGPVIDIAITAGGRQYAFPIYSEAAEAERSLMENILKETEARVPVELWDEMNRLRNLSYDYEE
jgi:hypothetical protein